jgi:ATP-dependent Clp protease adaptor protein ClpS
MVKLAFRLSSTLRATKKNVMLESKMSEFKASPMPSMTGPTLGPVEAPPPPVKPKQPLVRPDRVVQPKSTSPEPLWNVILIDDDHHTFEYVVQMLGSIFSYAPEKAFQMAQEVHESGRVIVATVHKELAELRQEQIMEYGPDPAISGCPGSMRAEIEPAV